MRILITSIDVLGSLVCFALLNAAGQNIIAARCGERVSGVSGAAVGFQRRHSDAQGQTVLLPRLRRRHVGGSRIHFHFTFSFPLFRTLRASRTRKMFEHLLYFVGRRCFRCTRVILERSPRSWWDVSSDPKHVRRQTGDEWLLSALPCHVICPPFFSLVIIPTSIFSLFRTARRHPC